MGWTLLPPLIQVFLNKDVRKLPQCLAIFNHLLEVCLSLKHRQNFECVDVLWSHIVESKKSMFLIKADLRAK